MQNVMEASDVLQLVQIVYYTAESRAGKFRAVAQGCFIFIFFPAKRQKRTVFYMSVCI